MTLENLRTMCRAMIPTATAQKVSEPFLDLLINEGVKDIAAYTACLKDNTKFNVTEDVDEYNLSTLIPSYIVPDKPGLWWNDGTLWKKLNPRTIAWLDSNRPNWRNLESSDPQDYSIDSGIVTLVPTPDTTLANGLWLYHGKKPTPMTDKSHYPFSGSTTEYAYLSMFDLSIVYYVKWKIEPMVSMENSEDLTEMNYKKEREEKFMLLKRRPDVSASDDTKFTGRR
jgi:hypothetical protein